MSFLMNKKVHDLKTRIDCFQAIVDGYKTAEYRKDDRNFKVGDWLNLMEWNSETESYTGATVLFLTTHIVRDAPEFGIPDGYCMLSFKQISPSRMVTE